MWSVLQPTKAVYINIVVSKDSTHFLRVIAPTFIVIVKILRNIEPWENLLHSEECHLKLRNKQDFILFQFRYKNNTYPADLP